MRLVHVGHQVPAYPIEATIAPILDSQVQDKS